MPIIRLLPLQFILCALLGAQETGSTPSADLNNEDGQSSIQAMAAKVADADIAALSGIRTVWTTAETPSSPRMRRLVGAMPRLSHCRSTRWPLLIWAQGTSDTGELRAWLDRGISPLFNYIGDDELPAIRFIQSCDAPVILLLQGYVQRLFFGEKSLNPGCAHLDSVEGQCPAWLCTHPSIPAEAQRTRVMCERLRSGGISPTGLLIDFESGPYLRNGKDTEAMVRLEAGKAVRCRRCTDLFGERIGLPDGYRAAVDQSRAKVIRETFTEPVRQVFPEAFLGNFFAWPIDRLCADGQPLNPVHYQVPQGAYPAYGYTGSGLNILQPRSYFVPGWRGWGRPADAGLQDAVDWNVFTYVIQTVSLAARTMAPQEKLIPWLGWLWRGDPGLPAASAAAYKETAIHALLRGAETIAIFAPEGLDAEFPVNSTIDRRELGPLLRNIVDLQAGYDEVLRFQPHFTKSVPLNLQHTGVENHPDCVWSGYGNQTISLVRTISFAGDAIRPMAIYGKIVELPFCTTGRWFWVRPDGSFRGID